MNDDGASFRLHCVCVAGHLLRGRGKGNWHSASEMCCGRKNMSVRRRQVLTGSAAGAVTLASGLASPAIAANEPIRIGYLPALTGPSSSTGVAMNRGTLFAIEELNAAGGINGRKIELIVRDTQSDPTKAVNGAAELIHRQKVNIISGPGNSGESLAATPLIARENKIGRASCRERV